ncbi:LOW QUALITY PROTEIN: transcription initiation factor TFIID subunit 5 [Lethenteron reissneri]|uniref:LOW QUALITY PROTEIN: transcription initiation factor TFIID subunit 5 n=1 Tax=Lethenteron reissneri TaxID=7753 RepID=UPI002AB69C1E|nr:LOW QUALITY PROTEIN: transcription initiation factor TFIID subunit 5 [Lethenteron reissneri]
MAAPIEQQQQRGDLTENNNNNNGGGNNNNSGGGSNGSAKVAMETGDAEKEEETAAEAAEASRKDSGAASEGEGGGGSSGGGGVVPPAPPPPPSSSSSSVLDRKALAAVLEFLQRSGLHDSVETLRREACVASDPGLVTPGGTASAAASKDAGAAGSSSSRATSADVSSLLSAYKQAGEAARYHDDYTEMKRFVESSLDCHKAELAGLLYPLFLHMYLELVYHEHEAEAKAFFTLFNGDQEPCYQDDLRVLSGLSKRQHLLRGDTSSALLSSFRTGKFVVRMARDSYAGLRRHLQERPTSRASLITQEHVYVDVYDGAPRTAAQVALTSGAMGGEAPRHANKSKVYYGLLKEPELEVPPDDEDEEGAGEGEEGRPKKKKSKKEATAGKSKKQDPNAPPITRIPLPELKDSDKLDKVIALKESMKRVRLGPDCLPSICLYTFLNAYQGLSCCDISDDSSLVAAGFSDSTVRVWSLTPKKLRCIKPSSELVLIDKEADDVMERIMDDRTTSDSKLLLGHGGPVFSTSFSPERAWLLSSSEDGTVRVWSLHTFTCLVAYRGHIWPVWHASFSPHGHYFVSAGHDRTARLWVMDHHQAVRVFAGHLSDVTCACFHPNSNYVATGSADRSVRVWDVLNGACVRTLTGHKGSVHCVAFSPNGRFLASGGADSRVLLWDIAHGLPIAELKGHTDTVYTLKFSRDGEVLASGGADCCVRLWDVTRAVDELDPDDFVSASLHSPPAEHAADLTLGAHFTKSTPVAHLHFTRRNLLLACGAFTP